MNIAKTLLAIAALMPFAVAHAAGFGQVTKEGNTTKLTNAYAYRSPDHFDKTKMLTVVVFTTAPVDTAAANAAEKPIDDIESQMNQKRATVVELEIAADGSVEQVGIEAPGLSTSGGTSDKPVLVRNDDKRIEGAFRTSDEKKKTNGFGAYYDLQFALDIQPSAKH